MRKIHIIIVVKFFYHLIHSYFNSLTFITCIGKIYFDENLFFRNFNLSTIWIFKEIEILSIQNNSMLINIIYISDNSSNSFIFSWYIKNLLENYWYKNRKFDLIIKLIDNNKYIFKNYLLIFSSIRPTMYLHR